MPKRGSDADSRIFFDELVSIAASRLKATGAIRLDDRHGFIAFGDKQKLVGVSHTVFRNGGAWSYFICPRCGGRKKKLWLVEDAPRCLNCCWSLGVAWLKDEKRSRGEMDGVRETIARQRRREVKIMTSVVTSVEVLSAKIPVGMDRLFADLLKRISRVGVDSRVATVAHDLRNHYAQKGGKTVSTTDAIHLATAIHYRADEFHTFDEGGSNRSLGLIPLSGDIGGTSSGYASP